MSVSTNLKLGIFGGTFNPLHNGHLAVARAVRDAHELDKVILVPAGRPPHKHSELAPCEERLAMASLAVRGEDGLEVSDIEVRRQGISYTIDTLEAFASQYPGARLYFIVGADSVPELKTWWNLEKILQLVRLVIVNRPGHARRLDSSDFGEVSPAFLEQLRRDFVAMPPCSTSSTEIRRAVGRDQPLRGFVPACVEAYIAERGLYRGTTT